LESLTKELGKWKEKYKVLSTYRHEEETNFKEKFRQLISVEEERFKIKGTINMVKNNPSALVLDGLNRSPDLTQLVRNTMSRSGS
jgi:hypothetical protein